MAIGGLARSVGHGHAPVRVLVVDDSALMRKLLVEMLNSEGGFEVQTAPNGLEALKKADQFNPDVITLDINMPEMDGLTALSMLMAKRPTPVVMVSSLTEKGAMATFEALALGAVDFIAKPNGTISLSIDKVRDQLIQKVRSAACSRLAFKQTRPPKVVCAPNPAPVKSEPVNHEPVSRGLPYRAHGVVLVGVSTGGPRALEDILPLLPASFPWPVVVAQHMPATFTEAFARRLDGLCALKVCEVNAPMPLRAGHVYIGKGGSDVVIRERAGEVMVLPIPESSSFLWHPSVEALLLSASKTFKPNQCIGVMLTGMGYDGAQTMTALKQQGARTIAESEETATVFGMPGELVRRQGASTVLPVQKIAQQIINWVEKREN